MAGVLAVGGAIVSQSLGSSQAAEPIAEPVTLAPAAVDQSTLQITSLARPDVLAGEVQALAKGIHLAEEAAAKAAAEQRINDASCQTTGFGGVNPGVAQVGHFLQSMFGIEEVGGVAHRPNNPSSDHPRGYALDFMVDKPTGDRLNEYIQAHMEALGVSYTMWQVAAHYDHVHVSFKDGLRPSVPCTTAD